METRMNRHDNPLELDAEVMRSMVDQAMERIVEHIESLPDQAMTDTQGGRELARSLVEPLPETGAPFAELLTAGIRRRPVQLQHRVSRLPGLHPERRFVPIRGGPISSPTRSIATSESGWRRRGLVELEANVVRWLGEIIGYPGDAGGFLTTGGSLANLTAVVTAREEKLPENFLSGTLYASDQVHHSVVKAARLAGFPERNVRPVPSDERFRIRIAEPRAADCRGIVKRVSSLS